LFVENIQRACASVAITGDEREVGCICKGQRHARFATEITGKLSKPSTTHAGSMAVNSSQKAQRLDQAYQAKLVLYQEVSRKMQCFKRFALQLHVRERERELHGTFVHRK
jgi:hypothetical protein